MVAIIDGMTLSEGKREASSSRKEELQDQKLGGEMRKMVEERASERGKKSTPFLPLTHTHTHTNKQTKKLRN